MARDLRGGMNAFRGGRLQIRDDLHLGVGFLAATSGSREPGRLVLARVRTAMGNLAVARAGHPDAQPVVMLHGLGGTKASFLPTVAALADEYRVHAIDLPGFGDSVKPLGARLRPGLLRPRGLRLHGRMRDRARAPDRQLDGRARGVRDRLPPLRARGPDRRADAGLFVWGRQDRLVPIAFARHVREALPGAQHLELDCGHVPQLEAPRETHAAIRRFLRAG